MSNTPTDAELDAIDMAAQAIANQNPIGTPFAWRKAYLAAFASAVLAKWGTPQPTAEGFALQALVAAGHVSQELVDKALALPGAPQPVVREPLTDEQLYEEKHNAVPQLFDLARDWADNKIHSYQFAHEAERIVNVVARRVEAAHGITQKGGSNADTGTN